MINAPYTFEVHCRVCRRRLGDVTMPRDHMDCPIVFVTVCRTKRCREDKVSIRFDDVALSDAQHERGF